MTTKISTHTLTWSVTNLDDKRGQARIISTHTLTWSVTQSHYNVESDCQDFNSHAHVERDRRAGGQARILEISTHTLTWSVTLLNLLQ